MERSCGFDICPPLEPTGKNRALYANFITTLLAKYESRSMDSKRTTKNTATHRRQHSRGPAQIVPAPNGAYIIFLIGGLPVVPYNSSLCHYFVRFSCRGEATAHTLVRNIYDIARETFGSRIKWWDEELEGIDGEGIWDQEYVDDMHRSMMRALETGWMEVNGRRRSMYEFEKEDEEDEPPPVPEKPARVEALKADKGKKSVEIVDKSRRRSTTAEKSRRDSAMTERSRGESVATERSRGGSSIDKGGRSGAVSPWSPRTPEGDPRRISASTSGSETLVSNGSMESKKKGKRNTLCDYVLAIRSRKPKSDKITHKKSRSTIGILEP